MECQIICIPISVKMPFTCTQRFQTLSIAIFFTQILLETLLGSLCRSPVVVFYIFMNVKDYTRAIMIVFLVTLVILDKEVSTSSYFQNIPTSYEAFLCACKARNAV